MRIERSKMGTLSGRSYLKSIRLSATNATRGAFLQPNDAKRCETWRFKHHKISGLRLT
jgi:hypothetical protein